MVDGGAMKNFGDEVSFIRSVADLIRALEKEIIDMLREVAA